MTTPTSEARTAGRTKPTPTLAAIHARGALVEPMHLPDERRTAFCVAVGEEHRILDEFTVDGHKFVPYSAQNNLIRNKVILLSAEPVEYGTTKDLIAEIQAYIHRYVDLSPLFERLACYYVLLSWVYEDFNELPYLRLLGDPGSGKTRFLLVVGSICYKPIFASGASSVSPLFRILDASRGTLIIDEGDFRLSDEKAEITKILNNGNARGFPVLRSEVSPRGEYNPTAYRVFGPKLVATRRNFQDRALETRCLTEQMGHGQLRDDIPLNLPNAQRDESLLIRNKLLMFRLRNLGRERPPETCLDRAIEPRLNQVFSPLLSMIDDEKTRQELQKLARRYNRELEADRGMSVEAQVLEVVRDIQESAEPELSIKAITSLFQDRHEEEYDRKITPKWIGWIVRKRLRLRTEKRHGVFVVADVERAKLARLMERYGLQTRLPANQAGGPRAAPAGPAT